MSIYKRSYVLPIPSKLRGKLLEYNRLYAFPTIPEPPHEGRFVILDSGAYGLYKKGGRMDDKYFAELNEHYKQYEAEHIYCACPDVFLDPAGTIKNFEKWVSKDYAKVFPIIQFGAKYRIDRLETTRQLDFYDQFYPTVKPFIAVSNPSVEGDYADSKDFYGIISDIKDRGYQHVHCLGAGWSERDIIAWANITNLDSIDSLAYYSKFRKDEYWSTERTAIGDAKRANELFTDYSFT